MDKNNLKEMVTYIDWKTVIPSLMLIIWGSFMFFDNLKSYQAGVMIPPTSHASYWMTAQYAIILDAMMIAMGTGFLIREGINAFRQNNQNR